MKMYEYKVEKIDVDLDDVCNKDEDHKLVIDKLNTLGREGWELCAADKDYFYLKKEI